MTQSRFIREAECQRVTGLSRSTRWRLEQEGKFPKRVQISPATIGWLASDLEEWFSNRVNNSNQKLPKASFNKGEKGNA